MASVSDLPPKADEAGRTAALTSLARTARVALLVLIAAAVLWLLSDIVLLIFAAVLIAVALRGVSDWLSMRTHLPPWASLPIVTVVTVGAIVLFGLWLGPPFFAEFKQLGQIFNHAIATAKAHPDASRWDRILLGLKHVVMAHKGALLGHSATSVVAGTLGGIGSVVLVLITALYLAAAPQFYLNGSIRLFPLTYRPRAREIALEIGSVLRWWMLGQLVDMVVVAVLASVGLALLHVPLALALGVLAGLLTFIPYVGAFIAAVPGLVVAMTVGLSTVVWVIVIYLGCHMIEGYVVSPLVTRRMVHLPPAVTVFSMAIFGVIYGGFGVVIATPITAAALVLCREAYVADTLGDPDRSEIISAARSRLARKMRDQRH